MNLHAKAFLFDLNGTIIDDMLYHADAWFDILNNDLKANLSRQEVKSHMYGKNEELLVRIFGDNHFTQEEKDTLSINKEKKYQQAYLPALAPIEGLKEFLLKARQSDIQMAIGSAAIPFNIDFVLDNLELRYYFPVVVSADDVAASKPHPETFLKCARLLNVSPADCIVFEDAPKGVESAMNAGMKCFVLTTTHEQDEFSGYNNVIGYGKDYSGLNIAPF